MATEGLKTVIVGGGKGCRAVLRLAREQRLGRLRLDLAGVMDSREAAPGMAYARELGIPTFTRLEDALAVPGLEMLIELVGNDDFLRELRRSAPPGIRILDHLTAQVFWELDRLGGRLARELVRRDALERRLETERNLQQQVLDSLPDAVIVVDREFRLKYVNARLKELTGLDLRDLSREGRYLDPFCARDDAGNRPGICYFREVARSGRPLQYIAIQPDQEGEEAYFRVIITPIRDQRGELAHLVETARPITEVVVQARETEERERRFRQFVEHAQDMITMKDLEGRYMVVNQPAAELIGMNPMDCIGRADAEILPPILARSMAVQDQRAIAERRTIRRTETIVTGGRKWILDTIRFPLVDYKGDVKGVCSLSRDVTEHKRLERAVLRAEKMAVVGKLATSVAHEINNPLTAVLTFAEELKADAAERDPADPALADFEVVIREAKRCRDIVSGLLDFSRLGQLRLVEASLNQVIEHTLVILNRQAAFKDIRFDLHLDPRLPDSQLDPDRIQQVLNNLVINAAHAMEGRGTITILTRVAPDGRHLEAVVRDGGPGVPPELADLIFEPFFSTKKAQGTGLGLSVARAILESHGGSLRLAGRPDKGAEFVIRLPRED